MRTTLVIVPLALAAVVAVPLAVAAVPSRSAVPVAGTGIAWRSCGKEPGTECASVRVPQDWSRPDGRRISLNVARRKATGERLGTLFYNPGGPGMGVAGLVRDWAPQFFSKELLARFDVVGVDPRGVAGSGQIRCKVPVHDPQVRQFPRTEREYEAMVAHNRKVGESCDPLIRHVDTASVARDFDAVRAALGETKVSYLGRSYGTILGTEYARLFPGRVRAMALDAVVDHGMDTRRMVPDAASAVEHSFDRFAAWCDRTAECALHGRNVGQVWDALVKKAERAPIPVTGGRAVTAEELRYTAYALLTLLPEFGNGLAKGIAQAEKGDASLLAETRSEALDDPASTAAYRSILCQDIAPRISGFAALKARKRQVERRAPHMRGTSEFWDMTTGCAGWPVPPSNPQAPVHISGVPPVLLVGNAHDPATPLAWARSLSRGIEGSRVLATESDGHTAYLRNSCATGHIDRYLVTGALPSASTCKADAVK
ncbi:alpha/beta hydrolase [Spirillospora sp. NBC_01491]|uniref:alpha/beta hydrolase n=1 Tax=Spirillospora sp. NBC_01491 TaxID=2976007 RepID=UPI002E30B8B8|nr:alpha/beta hydrolase [Spirillospora sp. NBC_01491]